MLDQSFSAYNFNEVFQKERRKGHIRKDYFPASYTSVLEEGHRLNETIHDLKQIKRSEWTDEQRDQFSKAKEDLENNIKQRKVEEEKWLESLADEVSKQRYHIVLTKVTLKDGKSGYTIPDDAKNLFVMKTLMSNVKKVFKVHQANRHRIMTQVKCMMNESTPKYIIRTDIHHFFESIPHNRLMGMIKENTLLSNQSISFICQVLEEYERKKSPDEAPGHGVPRGIGVSAYLSEVYLRDLDEKIKHRPEVVFFVRYVDDIFIVLSHLPTETTLEQYYDGIRKEYADWGLSLMNPNIEEQKAKLQLVDFHTYMKKGDKNQKEVITYLGYKLICVRCWSKFGAKLITRFDISEKKRDAIKARIDAAFIHFTNKTKYSLKEARRDLRDSLRFIVGNYKLTKSKTGIKAGIYYSSDLLSEMKSLRGLTYYLHSKTRNLTIYPEVLKGMQERDTYVKSIAVMVKGFNFERNWEDKKCYSIPDMRIREISQWL